ncbi:uncharacterized protein LOC124418533 [Lucilia cuprina]|uniref:uncharacterized protein LOC124418533 n=1 Tax=Lucilia cuprina TaxID=7375 RepID=UPI001F0662F5|nr:uncharacterized protein LOC124418533 [Lucilia cuprina]
MATKISATQLEARLGRLDAAYNGLKVLTGELYNFEEDKDFVDPEDDFAEYEGKYFMVKGIFTDLINSQRPHESISDPQNDVFNRLSEQHSALLNRLDTPVTTRNGDGDLPKIRIEPFTGKYADWPSFKDLFNSAIDSRPNLTNIQKFHYLKSVLKDDAANLIKHMQITDLSYSTVWDRLKERYDRPRHIVNSYIETFMSISSLKEENSTGLRKISDVSNEVIRGLEAIGFDERDHWLIHILQSKIDPDSRRKWVERTQDETKPTISSFLTFLDQRCEEIELGRNTSCQRSHNSLIHNSQPTDGDQHQVTTSSSNIVTSPTEYSSRKLNFKRILPTALVNVRDRDGNFVACRVLLDTASEYSYVTEDCIKRLGLPRSASRMPLSGIQSIKADPTRGHAFVHIRSRLSGKSVDTLVHILGHITASLPRSTIISYDSTLFTNLNLADPHWNRSSPIDILLGADEVWDVLSMEKLENDQGKVVAVSTIFGWVVTSGILPCEGHAPATLLTLVDLDRSIRAFWEIEDCSNISNKKDAESLIVEQHFDTTHRRHNDGKYIVELPFKEDDIKFAETYKGALARFNATERRLSRNPDPGAQYVEFMREYESLGHMRELSPDEIEVPYGRVYYLPHHPVVGSKLRVVFDGSFQDASGSSLNSKLYIPPSIQRNLFAVCLRFRLHEFVFSADIVKIFRQIWVSESHRNFQRILWRETPGKPLKHFQLCTVTYGTASAPFLSVRVLEQLAIDYNKSHPNASKILLEDFYVDDVLTGASSEQQLKQYRDELVDLLQQAGFQLSKWVSNSDTLKQTNHNTPSFLKDNDSTKVLGIHWYSDEDRIRYKICLGDPQHVSKRTILSDVARIFDPLGLVSPVVIKFKILFQELWLMNLGWDDPLPPDIADVWMKYREDLRNLNRLRLPRFVPNMNTDITLHGFSEASLKAYSAVIYCLVKDKHGNIKLSLIASKTRVSPLKQISLPRLELCGALLLTRLMKSVILSLPHTNIQLRAWCDSTVVLSWLSVQPITLKTFVGNRTAEILETLPRSAWGHVCSKENPADCASRGLMMNQLLNHDLWWSGPTFLKTSQQPESDSSQATINNTEVEAEMKTTTTHSLTTRQHPTERLLERTLANTSSWWKLLRIAAYVRRFVNLRVRKVKNPNTFLTFDEIAQANITCLKMAQDYFSSERIKLQRGLDLDKGSKLTRLSPYIDELGLLRVGGRIRHSELANAVQHPIILPGKHKISNLILEEQHIRNLHPGVSTLFVIIRQ